MCLLSIDDFGLDSQSENFELYCVILDPGQDVMLEATALLNIGGNHCSASLVRYVRIADPDLFGLKTGDISIA